MGTLYLYTSNHELEMALRIIARKITAYDLDRKHEWFDANRVKSSS